jgi:hypothetical protein
MRRLLGLTSIALLAAQALPPDVARAEPIVYTYSTTLTAETTDTAGLNGATATVVAMFSPTDTYVDSGGFPIVLADLGATYTISGASDSTNDGTFALPSMAFLANYAGLYTAAGSTVTVTLGDGVRFDIALATNPSTHGAAVKVGDTISPLDFAPATTAGNASEDLAQETFYRESNVNISVSQVAAVPEPSSLALCGIAAAISLAVARLRRKRLA